MMFMDGRVNTTLPSRGLRWREISGRDFDEMVLEATAASVMLD